MMAEKFRAYDTVLEMSVDDGVAVVAIRTDVDIASAPTVERYLAEASTGFKTLVLSFEPCAFMDSNGLRVLIATSRRLGTGLFVVAPAGGQVRRLLDLASLANRFNTCETRAEALARAHAPAAA